MNTQEHISLNDEDAVTFYNFVRDEICPPLELENRKLRTRDRELAEQFALASSQLQQISLEAHRLRAALHQRTAVATDSVPRT
ncbi:hypothetical protein [Frankia tisae]|uniref:hypothetical protein n=1 Tax=Frankia tisae TaxID=2950104 RepID=UPI0021BEF016|nr:hypothetical protein [Frankia tisae]